MASAVPFNVSNSLTYSPDDGQPDAIHALVGSGSFDVKADRLLNLSGAGTVVITLDSAAKALFIKGRCSGIHNKIKMQRVFWINFKAFETKRRKKRHGANISRSTRITPHIRGFYTPANYTPVL